MLHEHHRAGVSRLVTEKKTTKIKLKIVPEDIRPF